jgi:uncharacterized protein (DUF362 family)
MRKEDFWALERIIEEENDWRHLPGNAFVRDKKALVSIVSAANRELKQAIRLAVDIIGGVGKSFKPDDRVLLKANYNSDDPFPGSTDSGFLIAIVDFFREEGITDLTLGERSGWPWMPTANVLKEMGVFETAETLGLPIIDFDSGPWMDVKLGKEANWWDKIGFHKSLKDFDKIVFLPCMKHHFLARFTMSLKLTVGLTHPVDMQHLHADRALGKTDEPMELKMVEIGLPVSPDLIIMDGRKSFVTGGPDNGEIVEPNVILASGDRLANDVEGLKILQSYPRKNEIQMPIWEISSIQRAVELGLGVPNEEAYIVEKA